MKKCILLALAVACLAPNLLAQKGVTLEQLMSAPFPENLTAARTGNRIAWTFNQEGKRNIWVAEGPGLRRAGLPRIFKTMDSRSRN